MSVDTEPDYLDLSHATLNHQLAFVLFLHDINRIQFAIAASYWLDRLYDELLMTQDQVDRIEAALDVLAIGGLDDEGFAAFLEEAGAVDDPEFLSEANDLRETDLLLGALELVEVLAWHSPSAARMVALWALGSTSRMLRAPLRTTLDGSLLVETVAVLEAIADGQRPSFDADE